MVAISFIWRHSAAPGCERLRVHPDERRKKPLRDVRRISRRDEHVSAAQVDFIFQRQRDGHRGGRFTERAIVGNDRIHARLLSGGYSHDGITRTDYTAGHLPGKTTKVGVWTKHILNRESDAERA